VSIELTPRDFSVFNYLNEHQVLLEPQISWFVLNGHRAVMRDRLRKLYYLDYLHCWRAQYQMPWAARIAKPTVYSLTERSRQCLPDNQGSPQIICEKIEEHHLALANLRMLLLQAAQNNEISFVWQSQKAGNDLFGVDAVFALRLQDQQYSFGIINQPRDLSDLKARVRASLYSAKIDRCLIVTNESAQRELVERHLSFDQLGRNCIFATHKEIYKNGLRGLILSGTNSSISSHFGN
jgi:hypothetical protein